jgi:serine/threonine protein kinase, bacterial
MLMSSLTTPLPIPQIPQHPDFKLINIESVTDFGWAYLVEYDQHLVILEELLPTAETAADLETLQINLRDQLTPFNAIADPQAAASLGVVLIDDRLFWLREPVAGTSYQRWLTQMIQAGEWFEDEAVWDFLIGVLEPLARLHQAGVSHGAIGLDSVICRDQDGVIVLQRGGGIREFGLTHQLYPVKPWPRSSSDAVSQNAMMQDLYDLGWAALILLVGDDTIDNPKVALRRLQQEEAIGPDLHKILTRLLAPLPWQQFRDAQAVLQALPPSQLDPTQLDPTQYAQSTQAPAPPSAPDQRPASAQQKPKQRGKHRRSIDPMLLGLSLVFLVLLGILGLRIFKGRSILTVLRPTTSSNAASNATIGKFSGKPNSTTASLDAISAAEKQSAKSNTPSTDSGEIQGIPKDLYDRLKTELKPTTNQAESLINQQLQQLSEEAKREIGSYRRQHYDRWFASLSDRKISQPTVDILADTTLYLHLPSLQSQPLNPRSFGQIWYAIARDQITALNQQRQLKTVTKKTFQESGKLSQGNGRVFHLTIEPGEQVQINLQADRQDLRLSVIENEIVLTRDSLNTRWTAPAATQATTYEIILTPQKRETVDYQIKLQRR